MPNLYSKDWCERLGVCVKHGIPMTPCPKCLAEKSPHIQVSLTEMDRAALDWDPDMTVADIFPMGQEWLVDRIM